MAVSVPRRGEVTDALVAHLRAELEAGPHAILVGDGEAPPAAGWSDAGAAQRGTFVPYLTVATDPALPRDRSTVAGAHDSWVFGYRIRAFGATRSQADWAGDQGRIAAIAFAERYLVAGDRWKVSAVIYAQLGPVTPYRGTDPPTYQVIDVTGVWLDRSRVPPAP